jgi:hypothetical protein
MCMRGSVLGSLLTGLTQRQRITKVLALEAIAQNVIRSPTFIASDVGDDFTSN